MMTFMVAFAVLERVIPWRVIPSEVYPENTLSNAPRSGVDSATDTCPHQL